MRDRPAREGPLEGPAIGVRILVPGSAQWSWRQRERAMVLFGSFAAALVVGVFAWGTWVGLAMLAFAFGTHVAATVDVIRQRAFPGPGPWMPVISATGGLALGIYAPGLLVATGFAWPVLDDGAAPGGYLVDCWAYRGRAPAPGDWVWLRPSPWGTPRVARVVAGAGQGV